MALTGIDTKANHIEQLYHDLEAEDPRRADAVFEAFPDVLRFEEDANAESGELFVSRTMEDVDRLCQCEHAIITELDGLDGMRCEDCGEGRRFVRRQTVEEIVEVDRDGEFVEVIDADTRDVWRIECYECESDNVVGAPDHV